MARLYTCEHDDCIVVYEVGRGTPKCPLCEAQERVSDLDTEVENLKGDLVDAKETIESLKSAASEASEY